MARFEARRPRVRNALKEPEANDSVDWEIEHYLVEKTERLVAQGMREEEARQEAERQFGHLNHYRARLRRTEIRRRRAKMIGDLRNLVVGGAADALRTCRRHPAFAAAVILTLALGVGANAMMFGVIDRLLLRAPEHIKAPSEIRRVVIEQSNYDVFSRAFGFEARNPVLAFPDYLELGTLDGIHAVAGYREVSESTVGSGPDAVRLRTASATYGFFELLGAVPTLGRFFTEDEDRPDGPEVIVLGFEYWQSSFAGSPEVLGRTLEVAGRPTTVVGVAPPRFTGVGLAPVDAWLPLGGTITANCFQNRTCRSANVVVRLESSTDADAWQQRATVLHRRGRAEHIASGAYDPEARVVLDPLILARGPDAPAEARVAEWLGGVSLLVLLIACANVTNLMLARGIRSRRDLSVHYALGADRRALAARRVVESVLLALGAGAVGLLLAAWGGEVVRSALLPELHFQRFGVSGRVVLFTILVAIFAGVAAGAAPALQGIRGQLAANLGRGGAAIGRTTPRWGAVLAASQIAASAVLLAGAVLFVRSVLEVRRLDLGIDVDRVAAVTLELVAGADRAQAFDEAVERLRSLPGVQGVTTEGLVFGVPLWIEGLDSVPLLPGGGPFTHPVAPGHLATVGLRLLRGRDIAPSDGAADPPVAVVSETMALTLWPATDALGSCIREEATSPCRRVVGVVEDAHALLDRPQRMEYYIPTAQAGAAYRPQTIYLRVDGEMDQVLGRASAVLRTSSPYIRYAAVESLRDRLDPQARSWTLGATLFVVFGSLALIVAGVGVHSVLAFDVAQRTRELGIRTALGASRPALVVWVIGRGVGTGGIGIAVGLAVIILAAPRAETLLFQVSPRDPSAMAIVALGLLFVSALASALPALSATRADPGEAIRRE